MINIMNEAGSNHNYDNRYNQDAVTYRENSDYIAIILADGVSACHRSRRGAEVACEVIGKRLLTRCEHFFQVDKESIANCLIMTVMYELEKTALEEESDIEDYSSTLAGMLYNKKTQKMMYFSLGDSLIMASGSRGCHIVAMPSDSRNGCYVTTMRNASAYMDIGILDTEDMDSVIVCSDGAWSLMYDRNHLKSNVKQILMENNYDNLKYLLKTKDRFDDCSFISVDFEKYRRKMA